MSKQVALSASAISEYTESFKIYLKEINKFQIIEKDKERQLIKSAQDGDIKSQNELVRSNLRFVILVAKKHQHLGIDLDDLIQIGNIGLIEAIYAFDPDRYKDIRFLTYAVHHIRRAITEALISQRRTVRLPAHKQKDEFITVSLDQPVGEGEGSNGTTLVDIFVQDSGEEFSNEDKEYLRHAIKGLRKREQAVINMLFGIGYDREYNLEEVGEMYNVTGNRIRGIRKKAIKKLAKEFVG